MNVVEFIKKFGWEYAKHILTDDAPLVMDLNYTDLERIVESHELVMEFGDDTSYIKEHLLRNPTIKEYYLDSWCRTFSVVRLKQAIADVESCK